MPQRELGDREQGIRGRDAASGIAGEIHHQRASARADQRGEPLRIQPAQGVEGVANGNRAREPHHGRVDGKTRVRDEHFVAGLEDGEEGVEQHRLGPRNDDDVLCTRAYAAPRERRCNRIAEGGQTGRIHIPGLAIVQRADGCLDHVGRGRAVRLADLEVHHVAAGGLEAACRHEHLERALAREGVDSTSRNDGHDPPTAGTKTAAQLSGRGKRFPETTIARTNKAAGESLFSTLFNVAAIRGKSPRVFSCRGSLPRRFRCRQGLNSVSICARWSVPE